MTGEEPLVSVIVPTKNSAATLEACLHSIEEQTYGAVELIVVDNYSVDETREIADGFTENVFLKGPERSAQRNYGAERASGLFVLMIDSDMELSREVVSACVDNLIREPTTIGVVIPEESFGVGLWSRCKQLERSFYVGIPWMEAARFFSRAAYQAVGGYDESLVSGEDWDLSRRIARVGEITRVAAFIRHNEGHMSLWRILNKKYYYAQHARAYLARNPERSKLASQVGPVQRYRLFFSERSRLFANPYLGTAMLVMKTCEFISGGLGYVRSRPVPGKGI